MDHRISSNTSLSSSFFSFLFFGETILSSVMINNGWKLEQTGMTLIPTYDGLIRSSRSSALSLIIMGKMTWSMTCFYIPRLMIGDQLTDKSGNHLLVRAQSNTLKRTVTLPSYPLGFPNCSSNEKNL